MVRAISTAHRFFFVIVILSFIGTQLPADACASETEAGTHGASFLQIPVGPRLLASTEVVAGMKPDASLVFSNPASLSDIRSGQLFLTTANWLDEMQLNAASAVIPIPRASMQLAFSTRLLYSGGLKGYDEGMQVVSEENYYDFSFTTALSKRFDDLGLSLGAGVTYLREHLAPEDGSGYAFSLGAGYRYKANLFQFFARDIGGKITFSGYDYPVDGRYVLGYGRSVLLPQGNLSLGAQLTITEADTKHLQFGGEYEFNHHLIVRTALNHDLDAPQSSESPLSGGLGFRFWNVSIDYAYAPHSYFPATHMFSFTYRFGGMMPVEEPPLTGAAELPAPVFPSSPAAMKTLSPDAKEEKVEPEMDRSAVQPAEPADTVPAVRAPAQKPDLKKNLKQEAKPNDKKGNPQFTVVAGTHGRKQSALAEVRALQLLRVPAVMESFKGKYRVIIGRFRSKEAALSAAESYEGKGYRFEVVEDE